MSNEHNPVKVNEHNPVKVDEASVLLRASRCARNPTLALFARARATQSFSFRFV
jgi:hypothetical protein